MSKSNAFTELPAEQFPVDITFFAQDTGEQLGHIHIPEAGVVSVPGFHPRVVTVAVEFGDGTSIVTAQASDGTSVVAFQKELAA